MASNSSSLKSKRPKKTESLEWSNGNTSNDSRSSVKDSTRGKRMRTDESGIDVVLESDTSDMSSDNAAEAGHKNELNSSTKSLSDESDRDSGDPGSPELSPSQMAAASLNNADPYPTSPLDMSCVKEEAEMAATSLHDADPSSSLDMSSVRAEAEMLNSSEDEDIEAIMSSVRAEVEKLNSSDDEDNEEIEGVKPKKDVKNYDPTPNTPWPKHTWSTSAFTSRQYGYSYKYSPDLFRYNCYGSLHMVERLELMSKMKRHEGCVNALNFNLLGTRLVSGSDDLRVIVWDWGIAEPVLEYNSGHRTNVFQAKFMPFTNDSFIVTCARDGQVRLGELSSDGSCRGTKKVAQHKGSVHKLAIHTDTPNVFMTCGEDAVVYAIDLREDRPSKILHCKHDGKKVPLYSIFNNPQKSHEFAVAGRGQYVKIYDSRFLSQSDDVVRQFCPDHLVGNEKFNVTSAVYNYNGKEIIASYNDEDIYMFDSEGLDSGKYLHRYKGHRNNQTVKGVNYFGLKSEFIVSGSDCGYIFFWEKESEHIVKYLYGDEGGAVNCLEPHPTMPFLATSGLDDDIKIWVPSCEHPPDLSGLKNHLIQNMKGREEDNSRDYPDAFIDQTIWFLMQHLSRARPRGDTGANDDDSDASTTSSDEMYDAGTSAPQCNQS